MSKKKAIIHCAFALILLFYVMPVTALSATGFPQDVSRQDTPNRATSGRLPTLAIPKITKAERLALNLRKAAFKAWRGVRKTQEARYIYVVNAAKLWAYVETCPESDQRLARDLTPVDRYAEIIIESLVGSLFDEEWDDLESLDPGLVADAFRLLAKFIYSFELGLQIAESPTQEAILDMAQRKLCQQAQQEYQDLLISTKRKAMIALQQADDP